MILLWDHSHGKQEQQDLVVCRPYALPESFEEAEMLDNGWLALDRPFWAEGRWQEVFYQSRSTRIRTRLYPSAQQKPYLYQGKPLQMMEILPEKNFLRWTGMQQVYEQYLKRNGFRDLYNPLEHLNARDSFLLYYTGEVTNIIGFTKIKRYWFQEELMSLAHPYRNRAEIKDQCTAMESVMHANIAPISKVTLEMELAWAKRQGVDHFYTGSGYEKSSVYKAHIPGFQYWTGTTWSSNKRRYIRLCKRDSKISKILDLAK